MRFSHKKILLTSIFNNRSVYLYKVTIKGYKLIYCGNEYYATIAVNVT